MVFDSNGESMYCFIATVNYAVIFFKKIMFFNFSRNKMASQQTFTCLNSTMETPKQYLKSVQS